MGNVIAFMDQKAKDRLVAWENAASRMHSVVASNASTPPPIELLKAGICTCVSIASVGELAYGDVPFDDEIVSWSELCNRREKIASMIEGLTGLNKGLCYQIVGSSQPTGSGDALIGYVYDHVAKKKPTFLFNAPTVEWMGAAGEMLRGMDKARQSVLSNGLDIFHEDCSLPRLVRDWTVSAPSTGFLGDIDVEIRAGDKAVAKLMIDRTLGGSFRKVPTANFLNPKRCALITVSVGLGLEYLADLNSEEAEILTHFISSVLADRLWRDIEWVREQDAPETDDLRVGITTFDHNEVGIQMARIGAAKANAILDLYKKALGSREFKRRYPMKGIGMHPAIG